MDKNNFKLINNISFWKSEITISPVESGSTNQNFLVNNGSRNNEFTKNEEKILLENYFEKN